MKRMNVVLDACCPKIIVNLSWRHYILQGGLTGASCGSDLLAGITSTEQAKAYVWSQPISVNIL